MPITRYCLSLFLGLLLSNSVIAETVYISDRLVVGLYEGKTGDTRLLKGLPTGTPLVILQRDNKLAQVKTPDGLVGWIDASYTMNEKPSQLVVLELEDKYRTAITRLEARENEINELKQLTGTVPADNTDHAAQQALIEAREHIVRLETEKKELEEQLRIAGESSLPAIDTFMQNFSVTTPLSWPILGAIALAVLMFGILLGWLILDRINVRRHGGFRI